MIVVSKTKAKPTDEGAFNFNYLFRDIEDARMMQTLIEGWYDLNLEGGYQRIVDEFYEEFMITVDNADPDIDAICLLKDNTCENKADHHCQFCGQVFCMEHKSHHNKECDKQNLE